MRLIIGTLATLIISLSMAFAGPAGNYTVLGENADGSQYEGVVSVRQMGDTYEVVWDIGGDVFAGSGLGAAPVKGRTIVGPADPSDYVLAVGYISGGGQSFGIAYYVENEDGTWDGIWTFGGSESIGRERWTPQ